MSALERIYAWFRNLDRKSFQAVACQGNEPTEEDVAAFERDAGFALPADFRSFTMSPLGGLYLEVNRAIWPPHEEYAVAPAWTFSRGLMVFGIANGIPPWLDLRVQLQRVRGWGVEGLVPFFQIESDADRYCFDRKGAVWLVHHDEPGSPRSVGFTFPELVLHEIAELTERKREYERYAAARAAKEQTRKPASKSKKRSPATKASKNAVAKKKPAAKKKRAADPKPAKKKAPAAKRKPAKKKGAPRAR